MAEPAAKLSSGLDISSGIGKIIDTLPKSTPSPAPVLMETTETFVDSSAEKEKLKKAPFNFCYFPDELLLQIITRLDPVNAVIFGLTNSRFNRIVVNLYGHVHLSEVCMGDRRGRNAGFLWQRLEEWMEPRVYSLYADKGAKFVTREKAEMLEEREKSPWKFGAFGKVTWRE